MNGLVRVGIAAVFVVGLFSFGAASSFAATVHCGDVITQDTKLDNDLINCPGDGLRIQGNDLTLNLHGHTIDGVGQGYGVSAGTFDPAAGHPLRIVVENGSIQEFSLGFISYGGDQMVRDIRFIGNGIFLNHTGGIDILNNRISGSGIGLYYSGHIRIVGNAIGNSPGLGVNLLGFDSAIEIKRNRIAANASGGIRVNDSLADIENNEVIHNGGPGISFVECCNSTVSHNTASYNATDGIAVETFPDMVTVSRNTANYNGNLGINAVSGAIDGGGNKAKGNGNPLQCLNVFCK